jgi:hypothetical protein
LSVGVAFTSPSFSPFDSPGLSGITLNVVLRTLDSSGIFLDVELEGESYGNELVDFDKNSNGRSDFTSGARGS